MRTLFIIPLVLMSLVLTVSPVYSMNFLCGSVGIGCETLTRDYLIKKDDLYFKKFTNVISKNSPTFHLQAMSKVSGKERLTTVSQKVLGRVFSKMELFGKNSLEHSKTV